ncbi:MAG: carbohydrate kinase family protein [bacterium]|nr:carbohydrate kinase family protein [bacterium]
MLKPTFLSIGAAVQDVFMQGDIFKSHIEDGVKVQEFQLDSKQEFDDITISVGGGATNAATTFARQGLHSMFMGNIGDDVSAELVLNTLHEEQIDTSMIKTVSKGKTGYSAILVAPSGGRTILTFRGVSKHYNLHEADFHGSKPDWIYISSLSGDTDALKTILKYAKHHEIKVAINPGKGEIKHAKDFIELLDAVTILSLNKEEFQSLFGDKTIPDLLKVATSHVSIALLTDGPKGSHASDGQQIYSAGMYEDVPVLDRTGAGDAFSSGFVCRVAQGYDIKDALTFASANSTSVVGKMGAKDGILKETARIHSMQIGVNPL